MVTDIAILTPDNMVVRLSGENDDANGILDYEEIDRNGEHVVALLPDLDNPAVDIIRNFTPIRRNGSTIAYLYSSTDPETLRNEWIPEIYDGHGKVTIVNREGGEIIVDDNKLGVENIADITDYDNVRGLNGGSLNGNIMKEEKLRSPAT